MVSAVLEEHVAAGRAAEPEGLREAIPERAVPADTVARGVAGEEGVARLDGDDDLVFRRLRAIGDGRNENDEQRSQVAFVH